MKISTYPHYQQRKKKNQKERKDCCYGYTLTSIDFGLDEGSILQESTKTPRRLK